MRLALLLTFTMALCAQGCGDVGGPAGPGPKDGGHADAATPVADAAIDAATGCGEGELRCGGRCTNVESNAAHCGACGSACAASRTCVAGECSCGGGLTVCGDACVDRSSDPRHCGACDEPCGAGRVCADGTCRTGGCPADTTDCDSACVNTETNVLHCGACGYDCPAGKECVAGTCTCPAGLDLCGASCVDLATDRANCGDCGSVCGTTCTDGICEGCGPESTLSGQVQPILEARCNNGGCHGGTRPAADLSLRAGQSYGALVDRTAAGCSDGRLRVVPGEPDASYLVHKITGVGMCSGNRMPISGADLTPAQIELVRSWICRGARND